MATTVINVPQQAVGQQPIVLQQPGGQQPIVLPPGVFQQQVNNAQTTQGTSGSASRYNAEAGKVTGILQLIAAAVTIICTSIALAVGTDYRSGWGIWAGIGLYGLGGVLGIVSAGRNKGVIIAYLVFSILSSISAPTQMIYDSVAASQGGRNDYYIFCYSSSYNTCAKKDPTLEVVHAISAVAMFCEMIIAIVASCYCCCGGLCGNGGGQSHTQTVIVTQYPQQGAGTVLTTQHQQVPYQQPPYQQPPHQQQFQQPAPNQQPAKYQQQPPYQQPAYTAPGPSQQSPYTPLNFNQPGGANPSAPADPPPTYEASIRSNTSPAENPDNEYMEVTQ